MSDRYLWDRSGPADPEIERLERTLGAFRHREPSAPLESLVPRTGTAFRRWGLLAAAASLAALAALVTGDRPLSAWEVTTLSGSPALDGRVLENGGRFALGSWLVTDETSRARIDVGEIGEVTVGSGSRVGLLALGARDHRLELERGAIEARIWAPPGRFFVETPSALAVDLGCAYTLTVADDGAGELAVTSGWVAFERNGRESFVPAGARCATRPEFGPGTPAYRDASDALHRALDEFDFGADAALRKRALTTVLEEARARDALTLWHLLSRSDPDDRRRVFERLATLAPPPDSVTLDGILNRDLTMLDDWWNALGLEDVSWWRMWKQRLS